MNNAEIVQEMLVKLFIENNGRIIDKEQVVICFNQMSNKRFQVFLMIYEDSNVYFLNNSITGEGETYFEALISLYGLLERKFEKIDNIRKEIETATKEMTRATNTKIKLEQNLYEKKDFLKLITYR